MPAKKIIISKNDTAELAVIKLLKCKEDSVVLSIPNLSQLANSIDNFRLIKKEADEAGKEVIIESVDDIVVEFANRSELKAMNPFFAGHKKNARLLEPDPVVLEEAEEQDSSVAKVVNNEKSDVDSLDPQYYRKSKLGLWLSMAVVILLLPSGYAAFKILPRATINIITQKHDREWKEVITVDKSALALSLESKKVPGQIFNLKENGQFSFLATGKKVLNKKAGGTITIYNNHSSAPQSLVDSTRFETSDGKIFRLTEPVTVPGAQVDSGKVTPSSITAKVVADKGGDDFNIGPVEKFTIPGFKHTSKYNTFWAVSAEPMKGGFSGESAYPTDEDIKTAKEKAIVSLQESLKLLIKNEIPDGFKLIDGGYKFTLVKQTINADVNEKNEFSVFTDGELSAMAFLESDVSQILDGIVKTELSSSLRPKTSSLIYGEAKLDFAKGIMTVPVVYSAQLEQPIDKERIKQQLVGKSELEFKSLLYATPGMANAQVSLWPFWVRKVPSADKIDIKVE